MTTRNRKKLAALNKENCEEHPRSNLAQNSGAFKSQEDYITQVSEEIEGKVTKRFSKEFSRTENRFLGELDATRWFTYEPATTRPLRSHSGAHPNALNTSQGTNEEDSQNDPHPKAGLFHGQMTQNSGPEDGHYRAHSLSSSSFNTGFVAYLICSLTDWWVISFEANLLFWLFLLGYLAVFSSGHLFNLTTVSCSQVLLSSRYKATLRFINWN